MIIEKCSQIEFDLCIWTYLGRWGTDVICVSAEMRFCLNHYLVKNVSFLLSLPARGVWIEMYRTRHHGRYAPSHSPQGECGLKFLDRLVKRSVPGSLSLRRAWIEIGVCSVPATAWMSLSLFMSSVLRTCGDDSACAGLLVSMTI